MLDPIPGCSGIDLIRFADPVLSWDDLLLVLQKRLLSSLCTTLDMYTRLVQRVLPGAEDSTG
jgi:hypothetical protein